MKPHPFSCAFRGLDHKTSVTPPSQIKLETRPVHYPQEMGVTLKNIITTFLGQTLVMNNMSEIIHKVLAISLPSTPTPPHSNTVWCSTAVSQPSVCAIKHTLSSVDLKQFSLRTKATLMDFNLNEMDIWRKNCSDQYQKVFWLMAVKL